MEENSTHSKSYIINLFRRVLPYLLRRNTFLGIFIYILSDIHNNSYTPSTSIELYEIFHIFQIGIFQTHSPWTLTRCN